MRNAERHITGGERVDTFILTGWSLFTKSSKHPLKSFNEVSLLYLQGVLECM